MIIIYSQTQFSDLTLQNFLACYIALDERGSEIFYLFVLKNMLWVLIRGMRCLSRVPTAYVLVKKWKKKKNTNGTFWLKSKKGNALSRAVMLMN